MDMDELFSQVDEKRKVSKSLLFMSIEHVRVDKMYFFPTPSYSGYVWDWISCLD